MKERETKILYDSISNVDNVFIEKAQTKEISRAPMWKKWGALAACLCLVIGAAVTGILHWSHLPDNDIVREPEKHTEIAWADVSSTEPFGALFPTQIIEGYELEGNVALYGEGAAGVMEARFHNEQLGDELVVSVYAKGHYGNETLNEIIRGDGHDFIGSKLTVDGGDYVVRYFTGRDIAEIPGFEDMVRSAQAFGAILSDYPPLVMIDGKLYQDSGKTASAAKDDKQDGQITSTCGGLPTENNQSNFGTGYAWQYGEDSTVYIKLEKGWFKFTAVGETPPPDMIELYEIRDLVAKGYTAEDFKEKLIGRDVNTILQLWGEPDYQLSGVRGLGWYLDDENDKRITLYFDAEKYVEDISIDANTDNK